MDDLRNDDMLFRDDLPDVANNADLNHWMRNFAMYAAAYRIAADNLVYSCIYEVPFGRGGMDGLIYPIVFNYRQYIELRLKEIIVGLRYCNGDDSKDFLKHRHDLKSLWKELVKLYECFKEDGDEDEFKIAEKLIIEFHKMDSASFNFRYPLTIDGEENHLGITKLNIRNLAEVMGRLANFLDSLSDMVDYYRDLTDSISE